jgi:IS66 Orf2 like protein
MVQSEDREGRSCSQVKIGCREAADRRAYIATRRERGARGPGAGGERESGIHQVAPGLRAGRAIGIRCGIHRFASGYDICCMRDGDAGVWRRGALDSACLDPYRVSRPCADQRRGRLRSTIVAFDPGELAQVIEPRAGTIWIAAGVTDLRLGFQGSSAQVQTVLEHQPFSGHVIVFRGRRGNRLS